jgi:ribonuclease P protein component
VARAARPVTCPMEKADEKFPFSEKLRGRGTFKRVYEEGKIHRSKHVVLFCLPEQDGSRKVAFVASRKVGQATERNRARRRLREAYRKLRADVAGGAWLIFVARAGVVDVEWRALLGEMEDLLREAGVRD